MQNDCPLVIIRWEDSAQPIPAWKHLSQLPSTRAIECATVGWLLKDGDDVKVLCQSVGDLDNPHNAQASGIMTIPARCVISIERLTEEAGRSTSSVGSAAGPVGIGAAGTGSSAVPRLGSTDLTPDLAPRPRESESLPM
jgi:hypothetical protein